MPIVDKIAWFIWIRGIDLQIRLEYAGACVSRLIDKPVRFKT